MITLTLALDWTPNINHIGFFVAHEMGFYKKADINLKILNPLDDNYHLTPGKKLELDMADFALAPFETVISLNNKNNKVEAVAVFAILQQDLSCIVTLKTSGLNSPRDLDLQTYASYKARYEDHIVRQMIKNDGGEGSVQIVYPDKLGIWNTLLEQKAKSTWIFDNWEGVEADVKNVELNKFKMTDFGIPYGYSPVVLTKKDNITRNKEAYSRFIGATREGYLFVKENLAESAIILKKYLIENDLKNMDVDKSIALSYPCFGDVHNCGQMNPDRVSDFLNWLVGNGLEDERILRQELYSNDLISM